MAIITLETLTIDLANENPQPSSPFIVERGLTNLVFVSVLPLGQQLRNGYLLVIPALIVAGLTISKPRPVKYFPRGVSIEVPIAVPSISAAAVQAALAFIPIPIYRQGITPSQVDIRISYENDLFPPLGYPV